MRTPKSLEISASGCIVVAGAGPQNQNQTLPANLIPPMLRGHGVPVGWPYLAPPLGE